MERYGIDQWTAKPNSITSSFKLSLPAPSRFFESDKCGLGWSFCALGDSAQNKNDSEDSSTLRPITSIKLFFKPAIIGSMSIKDLAISVSLESLHSPRLLIEQRTSTLTLPLVNPDNARSPRVKESLGLYHPPDKTSFTGVQIVRFKVTFPDSLGLSFPGTSLPWVHRALTESIDGHDPIPVDMKIYLFHRRSAGQRRTQPKAVYASSSLLTGESAYLDSLFENEFKESVRVDLDSHSFDQIDSGDGLYDFTGSDSDLESDSEDEEMVDPDIQSMPGSEDNSSHDLKPDDMPTFTTEAQIDPENIQTPKISRTARLGRVVFIKDTAFTTWKSFIFYLCMKEIVFNSLRSEKKASHTPQDTPVPRCSPKSLYRLADKAGMTELQDMAFDAISLRLTEANIVHEVFSKFTSLFPKIQEIETDFLVAHYSSRKVAAEFARMLDDVAAGILPHSADVLRLIFKKMHNRGGSLTPSS